MKMKFLAAFTLMAAMAVSCGSKEEKPETVGEKLDHVIEETKTGAENAAEEVKEGVNEATEKIGDKAKETEKKIEESVNKSKEEKQKE
mgnify:FL=1